MASTFNNIKSYNAYSTSFSSMSSGNVFINNFISYNSDIYEDTSAINFGNAGNNILENIISYNGDGIRFSGTSSSDNILRNIKLYDATWGLEIDSGAGSNLVENIEVFNSRYGIDISFSDDNIFNNVQVYNSGNSGFAIGLDDVNNNVFNNVQVYNTLNYAIFLDDSYNNVFNNMQFYNNELAIDVFDSADNYYYGTLKLFGNDTDFQGTDGNDASFAPGVASNNLPSYAQSATSIGFSDGVSDTTGTMSCEYHSESNLVDSWGTNCEYRGRKWTSEIDNMPVTSYDYGSNIRKQVRPIHLNTTSSLLELYGTDGVDYDTTKYVGEF